MDVMPPPAEAPEAVMFLSPLAVALAACMLLVGGAVSMQLNLALHTQLLVAGIRMVLQLLALGYILVPIFAYNQAWLVLAYALFMLSVATSEASARSQYTYKGVFMHTLASMALSAGAMLTYTVLVVLARRPWWDAQYVIPILGMILGNATSGISVGLSAVLEEMASGKDLIEYKLALGADRSEATRELVSKGVRLAMLPVLNMMSVMGLVSIPGMMTGQILSGADPDIAARYQMMIVFVIAGTTSLAALISVRLAVNSIVDRHHCFRPELLTKRSKVTIFSRASVWLSAQVMGMWRVLRSLCCFCCEDNPDIEAPLHSSSTAPFSGPAPNAKPAVPNTGFAPGLPRVGGAVDRRSKGSSDSLTKPLLQDAHDATSGNHTAQLAYAAPPASLHASIPTLTENSQRDGSSSSSSSSLGHKEPHQIKAMHPAFMATSTAGATSVSHSIAAAAASSNKQALEHITKSTLLTGPKPATPTVSDPCLPGLPSAARTAPVLTPVQMLFPESLIPVVIPAAAHKQTLSEADMVALQALPAVSPLPLSSHPISSSQPSPASVMSNGEAVAEVLKAATHEAPVVVDSVRQNAAPAQAAPTAAATTSTAPSPPVTSPSPATAKPGPLRSAANGGKKGKGKKK